MRQNKAERERFLAEIGGLSRQAQEEAKSKYTSPVRPPSLLWCLVKLSYGKFLSGALLKLVHDLLQFVGPNVLE
jgi:hypothetical protein